MSRMLQLGCLLFDVQGVKRNFHLRLKQNTMESMSSNKKKKIHTHTHRVEQKVVVCGHKTAEKHVPLSLSPKNSTHAITH